MHTKFLKIRGFSQYFTINQPQHTTLHVLIFFICMWIFYLRNSLLKGPPKLLSPFPFQIQAHSRSNKLSLQSRNELNYTSYFYYNYCACLLSVTIQKGTVLWVLWTFRTQEVRKSCKPSNGLWGTRVRFSAVTTEKIPWGVICMSARRYRGLQLTAVALQQDNRRIYEKSMGKC